jgi:integrase
MTGLHKLTLADLQKKFTAGEVTARDIVQSYTLRINQVEPKVRAYITRTGEMAMEQAEALDAKLKGWRRTMPLMGMPVAIKDNICTERVLTTCASRMLAIISKIFRLASERSKESGLIHRPSIHRQKEGVGRVRWLTQLEEQGCLSLLSQWAKDDHAEAFIVLIDTGMRAGELWRVSARDCTFGEKPAILVWGRKNNTYRSVPMTTRVRDILTRRASVVESGPLFPFDNRWFEYTWDRVKVTMNLDHDTQFVPHALRHTCASRLIQRGVPLKVVQEWLGHKSITTTMRYSHLAAANLFEAAKVLEAI